MKRVHRHQSFACGVLLCASLSITAQAAPSGWPGADPGAQRSDRAVPANATELRRVKTRPDAVTAALTDAQAHEALDQELSLKVGKQMREDDYPDEARRRRWTGTVLIEVLVARDGIIKQVELARTSGFAILDERALDVVRRVPRLFVPLQLRGGETRATVPIAFHLQD